MARLLLADGSSQIHRAFHALARGAGQRLAAPDGTPTGALHAFLQILRKAMRDHAPDMVAVSFDRRERTFRHDLYPEYKAQRDATPEDLLLQIDLARKALAALRVEVVDVPGYEADDVIATLTRRAVALGHEVVILTSDKDLLQLVGPRVVVHHAHRDLVMDCAGATAYFGAPPSRIRDVLSIQGDSSDNVPGVPGIGEKGARQLVELYGDLETILASTVAIAADERLGRLRKRLASLLLEHADSARLARTLVTLKEDVPLEIEVSALMLREPDREAAAAFFGPLGFTKLASELRTDASPAIVAVVAVPQAAAPSTVYRVATTPAEVAALASSLRAAGRFALEAVAEAGGHPEPALAGLAFSSSPGEGTHVPLRAGSGPTAALDDVRRLLGPLLADPTVAKIGHDLKAHVKLLARHDLPVDGVAFDTMLASYLLDSGRRSHAPEGLAADHIGHVTVTTDTVVAGGDQAVIGQVEVVRVVASPAEKADVALRLSEHFEPRLRDGGLLRVFRDIEMPLVPVLAEMELTGVRIDTAALAELSMELEKRLFQLEHEIHAMAGRPFNIQSPKQLGEILFDVLGLGSKAKTTKTGARSTSVDVLEDLAAEHPLPALILEHRELSKLKGTYVDVLPRLVNARTGRVHTSYNQSVASTGRLSSSDPNFQNIPTRTELGRRVRKAFVPAPGHRFVGADYSQVELRIMAHLSEDAALCSAFARGEDIHRSTAALVFHVMPEMVTDDMRRKAKEVNFGVLYGMTAHGLAQRLGCSRREAQGVIDRYMGSFPSVRGTIARILDEVRADPKHEARTLFGRVRALPDIVSRNQGQRSFAERAAVNAVVQGTAADIIKLAMVALHRRLRREEPRARLILQVHDELVVECPVDAVETVRAAVAEEMQNVVVLKAPLEAVASQGDSWFDL